MCFDFLYNFSLKNFSLWEEMSDIWLKMYIKLHIKYPLFCPILMEFEFSLQIVEKYSNIKFHENPSSGSWVVPRGHSGGQTERHDEANSRFSQFCERAWKWDNTLKNPMKNDQLVHPSVDGIVILLWTFKGTFSWYRMYSCGLEMFLLRHTY